MPRSRAEDTGTTTTSSSTPVSEVEVDGNVITAERVSMCSLNFL